MLIIIYSSQEENLLTSVISVHHFRLSLWDATNNSLVNPLIMLMYHIWKTLLNSDLETHIDLTFPNEGLPDLVPAPHPTSTFNWRAHWGQQEVFLK